MQLPDEMFEDRYELALAVMKAIEARAASEITKQSDSFELSKVLTRDRG